MPSIRIEGAVSGNVAEVNSSNQLLVALQSNKLEAGYATITSEVDAGTVTYTRLMRDLEVSTDYRLRVGIDTPFFYDYYPGIAIDNAKWGVAVGTMTVVVATGWLTLNSGLSTAASGYATVRTYRNFPLSGTGTLYGEIVAQFAQPPSRITRQSWVSGLVQPMLRSRTVAYSG